MFALVYLLGSLPIATAAGIKYDDLDVVATSWLVYTLVGAAGAVTTPTLRSYTKVAVGVSVALFTLTIASVMMPSFFSKVMMYEEVLPTVLKNVLVGRMSL